MPAAITRRPGVFVAKTFQISDLTKGRRQPDAGRFLFSARANRFGLQQNQKLVDFGMAGSGAVFMKGYFQSHYQPAIGIVA